MNQEHYLDLNQVENGDKRLQSLNYIDSMKANEYQIGKDNENEGND